MRNSSWDETENSGFTMNFNSMHVHQAVFCCLSLALTSVSSLRGNPGSDQASVIRGSIVFKTYCVLCHGSAAQGDGRLAVGKMPLPANLTKSRLSDAQKEEIIRAGGESVGRSPFMPPWGEELSDEQIRDLVRFLRTLVRR